MVPRLRRPWFVMLLGLPNAGVEAAASLTEPIYITPRGKTLRAKTLGQVNYLKAIAGHDLVFAIGPAGTGKTYLAVVMAVAALKRKEGQPDIIGTSGG